MPKPARKPAKKPVAKPAKAKTAPKRTARPDVFQRAFAAVQKATEARWPNHALRHGYASYRFPATGNAAQTAEECGHSHAILKKNYQELVTAAEARSWFAVMPAAAAATVIPFPASA
jgi:integrase